MTQRALTLFLGLSVFAFACAEAPDPSSDGTPPGTSTAPPSNGAASQAPSTQGNNNNNNTTSTTPQIKSGALLFGTGAPIVGARYEAGGGQKGVTSASGAFTYEESALGVGAVVRFWVGDLLIGSAPGVAILSPYQLAQSTTCEDTIDLQKLVALLEALDTDADATNGINLPATSSNVAAPPPSSSPETLRTFLRVFDGEAWSKTSTDTFTFSKAVVRGQGITTDGTSWFFSGTTGLERTDAAFSTSSQNTFAIPFDLTLSGSDHIGDIDFWNGKIYAPVEDKKYEAPKVILYDPSSLTTSSGSVFDIPVNLQTKGVPWIAVDGPRNVAYMAEWDPTPSIHVFALASMTYLRSIDLSTTIGRVQGGKVHRGQLYLSTDDAAKTVYKVHLASGTVLPLFALTSAAAAATDIEMEGLAFFARPDGSLLHTLNITSGRTGVDLSHHTITREPLRWKVCP